MLVEPAVTTLESGSTDNVVCTPVKPKVCFGSGSGLMDKVVCMWLME